MELYILKSAACLAILFSFYKLVLEKEQMHTFKRFYLLGAIAIAFTIPLMTFNTYAEASSSSSNAFISEIITSEADKPTNYLPVILWGIYTIGLLFFSIKFFRNLGGLILKIHSNPKVKINRIINVLLQEATIPHTFFSFIFLNKQKFEAQKIPEPILIHERAHARQKHSLDILLIEILQIIFWFNPFMYLIKRSIKLNHEFLADQTVLKNGVPKTNYQNLLVAFSSNDTPQLANSINYSSIKKRITVMKTQTSKRGNLLRTLVLLPLLALLIFGFSSREVISKEDLNPSVTYYQEHASPKQIEAYNKMAAFWNQRFAETNERIIPLTELSKLETIYRVMNAEQKNKAEPFPKCDSPKQDQEKATPEQVREYNKLARKYNTMDKENMFVMKKDVERLKYLYDLMSSKQRKNAEPFPNIPPPPPKAPKAAKTAKVPKSPKEPKSVIVMGVNDKNPNIPPPPPKAPKAPKAPKTNTFVEKVSNEDIGLPPPPPMVSEKPLDHIIRMAHQNAAFFYEGEKISSSKAIEILKKNNNLNIETKTFDKSNPIVNISSQGIKVEK